MIEAWYLVMVIYYLGKSVTMDNIPQLSEARCVENGQEFAEKMSQKSIKVYWSCAKGIRDVR